MKSAHLDVMNKLPVELSDPVAYGCVLPSSNSMCMCEREVECVCVWESKTETGEKSAEFIRCENKSTKRVHNYHTQAHTQIMIKLELN